MASVHIDLTDELNKIKVNSQEVLGQVMNRALRRSCNRIISYARKNHPSWKSRTGALERAITFRFIRESNRLSKAEVYVSDDKLYDILDEKINWIDPDTRYTAKEIEETEFPENSEFGPYYKFYPDYLIYGTKAKTPSPGKAFRFIGKDRKLHFIRYPNRRRGIRGNNWLENARRRVNIGSIVREVLDEYGFKHN